MTEPRQRNKVPCPCGRNMKRPEALMCKQCQLDKHRKQAGRMIEEMKARKEHQAVHGQNKTYRRVPRYQ